MALGVGVSFVCCVLAGALLARLLLTPPSFVSFVSGLLVVVLFGLAALFGYWSYGLLTLTYRIGRDQLAIRWGAVWETVPLASVWRIVAGESVAAPAAVHGVNWPGYHVGRGRVEGLGEVAFFSAHRSPRDLIYVVTPTVAYGLSVGDGEAFTRELMRQRRLVPAEGVQQAARLGGFLTLPLWSDRAMLGLLAVGIAANLLLFAVMLYSYPLLPELLPIRVSLVGEVTRIGQRDEVLQLPLLGLAVLALNGGLAFLLYYFERSMALVCLGAGIFIQLLLMAVGYGLLR